MNGGRRILLNTIVGVILAAGLMAGLTILTSLSQTPTRFQAGEPPPKTEKAGGEGSLAQEAAPREEQALVASEEGGGPAFVVADPATLGAPFALALAAGLATFLIVRSRIDRADV